MVMGLTEVQRWTDQGSEKGKVLATYSQDITSGIEPEPQCQVPLLTLPAFLTWGQLVSLLLFQAWY